MTKKRSQVNEILLLLMLEDACHLLRLIGYSKVSEKIERNLERIYGSDRPSTKEIRSKL
jgi:hypothetical protein